MTAKLTREKLSHVIDKDRIAKADDGSPMTVCPISPEETAAVLSLAGREGWTVHVKGSGSWVKDHAPTDLVLATTGLVSPLSVRRDDLVATVPAGIVWTSLEAELADNGAWIPVDPPGRERTVGSVLATASTTSLRSGFGGVRDQVVGLSFVTGNGRIVKVGGEVVKNVAGFDLAKMAIGSFGAFGVIVSANFRLRAKPQDEATFVSEGSSAALLERAWLLLESGLNPAGLELIAPDMHVHDPWTLAVRLLGSEGSVASDREVFERDSVWRLLEPDKSKTFWSMLRHGISEGPVGIRIGSLIRDVSLSLSMVETLPAFVSAAVAGGITRANGHLTLDDILRIRRIAAEHNQPVTVERAPWKILKQVGHTNPRQESTSSITANLTATFDPYGTLSTTLTPNS
ncbi:MAG: FAD-binding oxidoreductase [Gemmatimonadota bacterium]|nr:FAD-binding oxidoreductase [Gemmatimonadota bacterium]